MASVTLIAQTTQVSVPLGTAPGNYRFTLTPTDGTNPLTLESPQSQVTFANPPAADYDTSAVLVDANSGQNIGSVVQGRRIESTEFFSQASIVVALGVSVGA